MSYLFINKPDYYTFISNIESERDEFRKIHKKYAEFEVEIENQFKKARKKISERMINSNKSMHKLKSGSLPSGARRRIPKTISSRKANNNNEHILRNGDFNENNTEEIMHSFYVEKNNLMWPVRTNDAERILRPRRLLRYDIPKRVVEPILVNVTPLYKKSLSQIAEKPTKYHPNMTQNASSSLAPENKSNVSAIVSDDNNVKFITESVGITDVESGVYEAQSGNEMNV